MQRRDSRGHLWVPVIVLVSAALACDLAVGGPTPPASPIAVSTEAAGQLQDLWKGAIEGAQGGEVSVVVSETQLTSFVSLKLAEQSNPPLQDVQVFLRDNQLQVFGKARAANLSTTALVALAVNVTPEGQVEFSVEKADFGPFPVPASLLESLSAALNEAFTGQFGSLATGIQVTSVLIADGNMAIAGRIQR